MEQLKKNEYRCAICHKVFKKGWTDEEALEEKKELFSGIDIEECDLLCDDCFNKMNDVFKFKNNKEVDMRIAYLVEFQVMTRVVVNTETKREDEEENAINEAIKKILADPDEHIISDNISTVNEDKKCPAGSYEEE